MNAYDFDHCIYAGDCTIDFYRFCLRRKPALLRYLPRQIWGFLLFAFAFISKTEFKERFFCFLQGVDDLQNALDAFWATNKEKIYGWFFERRSDNELIISASPEFLLQPVCKMLGVQRLIASRVDPQTGKFTGENCYGAEKPKRLLEELGTSAVETFYSDSLSDSPMAQIAQTSYIVRKGELTPWSEFHLSALEKAKRYFFSFEFFRFLVIGGVNTLNGVVFSYLFSRIMHAQVAFWCGYLLSLGISYLLNSAITFHERLSVPKMLRFFISYIPNFLIQNIVVFLVHGVFGGTELMAYILAAVIGIPVTFVLLKLFAFRKKKV
ncbi:MAG: haloacid dehalogenase-like hydrolase [Christensenella sp.]|nr:haloacid dehalogenase-like hydrolase [Christensenella sp.]